MHPLQQHSLTRFHILVLLFLTGTYTNCAAQGNDLPVIKPPVVEAGQQTIKLLVRLPIGALVPMVVILRCILSS